MMEGRQMLWRDRYSTRILEPAGLLPLAGMPESGLVLVGRGAESVLEQELWRKLAVGEGVAPVVQGLVGASEAEFAEFRAAAPPSLASGFRLWTDPSWAALLAEESPARALAWSPASDLAMIGPATEEAWDRMLAGLRA